MIKHKRVHGAAGGFVAKGGSFSQEYDLITPGYRFERSLVYADGPAKSNDLGFRLVVAAPEAVSSVGKQKEINQSFSVLKLVDFGGPGQGDKDQGDKDQADKDQAKRTPAKKMVDEEKFNGIQDKLPLEKINVLLETAVDPDQAALFESLRADIQGLNFNQKQSAETAIKTNCRNLLFMVYSIYNTEKRRLDALANAEVSKAMLAELATFSQAERDRDKEQYQTVTENHQRYVEQNLKLAQDFEEAMVKEFHHYLELLSKHDGFDSLEVNSLMLLIFQDIKGDDFYATTMRRAFQQVNTDLGNWRMGKRDLITVEAILKNSI
jgi:hypothetical protein